MARNARSLRQAFGKALASLRRESGVSQEAFAFRAQVHRTYISQLERGLKSPTLDTIAAIANVLRLRPHQLVKAAEEHLH